MTSLSTLAQRLGDRTEDLRRLTADVHNAQIELQWQLVATEIRQVVPEATGVRLEGYETEQGMRYSLVDVLVDGEPASVSVTRLGPLENALEQPLLYIAELDEDSVVVGEQDEDLPEVADVPGSGLLLTVPLLDAGELRVFEPDPAEGDLGRMWVLDVLGVSLLVRQRPDGVYVHVDDGDATTPPEGADALLVEVRNAGESEHTLSAEASPSARPRRVVLVWDDDERGVGRTNEHRKGGK
jgi:hypothetical protein